MTQNIYPAAPVTTAKGEKVDNYTGYAWAGSKYQHGLTTKEIAAKVRAEIRAKYPIKDGYRIGVKYNSFSMGSSIDITVRAAPFKIYHPSFSKLAASNASYQEYDAWETSLGFDKRYNENRWAKNKTIECNELLDDLKAMINAYRYDDSDGMIDYFNTNFYEHVTVDWEMSKDK